MAVIIQWNGNQVGGAVANACFAGVLAAATWLKADIVKTLSKSGRAKGGGARSPTAKGTRPMKVYRSKPGDPPFADTGKLRQSIFMDSNKSTMSARVGTTSLIGVFMELGVQGGVLIQPVRKKCLVFPGWVEKAASGKKGARNEWSWVFSKGVVQGPIAPRPWLRPAAMNNQHHIRHIIVSTAAARLATDTTTMTGMIGQIAGQVSINMGN